MVQCWCSEGWVSGNITQRTQRHNTRNASVIICFVPILLFNTLNADAVAVALHAVADGSDGAVIVQ